MARRTLLFILADRPGRLVDKGELSERYYNPGDLFDEVHLLTTSGDAAAPSAMGTAAGRAELHVHRLWAGPDRVNMALAPLLERTWARRAVGLAHGIRPDVVRTGDRLTGYLGWCVKRALGVPHIVSLHTERDDARRRTPWGMHRLMMEWERRYARIAFPRADAVIVVYESIRAYAKRYGAQRIERIYNVVSRQHLAGKSSYALAQPPRVITVGRQLPRKLPDQLIRAFARLQAELLVVGDGPCHERLRSLAAEPRLAGRVRFVRALPNAQLCAQLSGFDLFAAHTAYPEFPKTVMEGLWQGLPVVVNDDQSLPVPEFQGDWVCRTPNTEEGYAAALFHLLSSAAERERLGRRGREYAEAVFHPVEMEERQASLYREFLG